MGRAVYQYELADPDFTWLVSSFQERHPDYSFAESATLPVVFIQAAVNGRIVKACSGSAEEPEFGVAAAGAKETAGTEEKN